MEKSETPRTDALLFGINEGRVYTYDGPVSTLARDLERETIALSAQVRELREEKLILEGALQEMGKAATRLANEKRELTQSLATAREEALDGFLTRLHNLAGYCTHCGKTECAGRSSNSMLPERIRVEHVLRALKPTEAGGGETK